MGSTLSFPVIEKRSQSGQDSRFLYAVTEMQGWRIAMEDAHAAVLDLDEGKEDSNTFFAVYDGHGGGTVARYAGQNLHKRLVKEEMYQAKSYESALKKAFLGIDEDLLANPTQTREPSGCTAVVALITNNKIYVANAGDSRSILNIKGESKPLSFDHKPTSEVEQKRIHEAGSYIDSGRVNGNLALSRALGDFEFKKNWSLPPEAQAITANPDVLSHEISSEDEFLVLACDGIWDCLTSQQVVDFVRYQVAEGKELSEIGEMICDHCLAPDTASGTGIGCDNMTILIVGFLHGRTKEEWYAWIKDRVKNGYGRATPGTLPQLYSQSRLLAFKSRMEAFQERKNRSQTDDRPFNLFAGSGLNNFARVFGPGISFQPGGSIMSDSGKMMFMGDDSDDEEGEEDSSNVFFNDILSSADRPDSPDATQRLKARLDEFERDFDKDGDMIDEADEHGEKREIQGEAPPPPSPLPNGDSKVPPAVQQLSRQPDGDAPPPVLKAEGFLDTSEDPLKAY